MSVKTKPWRENVAAEMIRQIQAGTAPWQKPWAAGALGDKQHNPTNDNPYRGINALWLEMQGFSDPRWMTLRQANALGAKVRSGEKSTQVEYWMWADSRPMIGDDGAPVMGDDGKPKKEPVLLDRPKVFYANVFNAEQIDGLAPYFAPELSFEPIKEAEKLLAAGGVDIHHDQNDRAFYQPSRDQIHLPQQAAFSDAYQYYATALHELGHATGHSSRMDRDFGPFGSEVYAKEELRAEMTSYMVARDLGLGHYPDRHASYVESWLKALKEDHNVLFQAARDAEHISQWIQEPEMRPALEKNAKSNRKAAKMEREQEQSQGQKKASDYEAMIVHDWQVSGKPMSSSLATHIKKVGEYEMSVTPYDADSFMWEIRRSMDPKDMKAEHDNLVIQNSSNSREEAMADAEKELKTIIKELSQAEKPKRVYLAVPFEEKDQAKEHGAKWDRKRKSWYAPEGVDMAPLEKWKPENQLAPQKKEVDPVKEFADELKKQGVTIKGDPIMDGKWHRARLDDDKGSARNASYRAFLDGRPNGQIKNYKTDELTRWVATGETLTKEQLAALKAEAAEKQALRFAELKENQDKAAKTVQARWDKSETIKDLADAQISLAYLRNKNVLNHDLRRDDKGNILVPARDIKGQLWSLQSIQPDGTKRFPKNARKTGLMHIIDPEQKIGESLGYFTNKYMGQGSVIIAEGYATAASIHEATKRPTIVAFDAGNLKPVAEAVRKQYPHAKIIIAADNDHKLESKPYGNVGKRKATEAALAVGGFVVAPGFDDEQKAKGMSDWNDLAQANGKNAIVEQMRQQLKRQRAVQKGEKPQRAALEM